MIRGKKSLDEKLERIRRDPFKCDEFIIADAKDGDMGFGLTAPGPCRINRGKRAEKSGSRWKTLQDYRDQIRAVIDQSIVDVVLLSTSNLEQLGIKEGRFFESSVTPAARANDTTDIWVVRGGKYTNFPSRPFRTTTIDHIKYGRLEEDHSKPIEGADLGLYSITFTNDLDWDRRSLSSFRDFRLEAEKKRFRYFLEVFNPNIDPGIDPKKIGSFLNDHIIRCLAGVPCVGRPLFLKIPYNGPGPLEELVSYDPQLIVGILGGSAGTTRDAFQLIYDAKKYGARVALFGRKINLSEDPLSFIEFLRRIADEEIGPIEAVKAYHSALKTAKIEPLRQLPVDIELTDDLLIQSHSK